MADAGRARKLAERIHVVVASTLENRVKDPRLGFVTVTETRVTNDLQHATVFYTVLGDEEARASTAAALESAKGIVRSEVGRATGIRLTPTLEFIADAIPESSKQMEDLLDMTRQRDAEIAAAAAKAQYAGDADPYKKPVEIDDEDDTDDDEEDDDDDAAEQRD